MSTPDWQGTANKIVYYVMFTPRLDDKVVDDVAEAILQRRSLADGPQVYYDALTSAANMDLSNLISSEHSADDLRHFFQRLHDRLDKARPWPEPAYAVVPLTEWDSARQQAIARIELTTMQVTSRLRKSFLSLPHGDGTIPALILRLRDGREVGLLGAHGIGNRVTLLQRGEGDPTEVVHAFSGATGIAEEEITPLWR
ncbi:MAG TPA: hypothetical protein VF062_08625 [Candidatus Limnocylindrales bacterium]